MIEPMRVEWTTPDEGRRAAAREQMERDRARGRLADSALERALLLARDPADRADIVLKHYPDLAADTHHFGAMIDVRYVAEQWGVRTFQRGGLDFGTAGSEPMKLCDAKWIALVVTEGGTVEMDPRTLRVLWRMAPGDPLCGTITGNELIEASKRAADGQQWSIDVAEQVVAMARANSEERR